MRRLAFWVAALALLFLCLAPTAWAQRALRLGTYEAALVGKVNENTIGLAAGLPEGAPLRFATELARIVDDGTSMRVLPIVTRGITENVQDLLYLRGIDVAIVYGDMLDQLRKDPKVANIEKRLNYITHLFPSELHVFVRPEIKSLEDLAGKTVNFNTQGTAAAYSGPIIFDRLGIKVTPQFIPHPVAMAEMSQSDKFSAVVFVSSKPLDPFVRRKWPEGFKFLPVPLTEKLEEYYLPAQLDSTDYPGLIPDSQTVQTVSVPALLAVFAWPQHSDRYRRLERFINRLFERLPHLQKEAGYHPKWRELNLAAHVPGWQRFRAMQAKLVAVAATKSDFRADGGAALAKEIAHLAPGDTAEQARLLREFLATQRRQ